MTSTRMHLMLLNGAFKKRYKYGKVYVTYEYICHNLKNKTNLGTTTTKKLRHSNKWTHFKSQTSVNHKHFTLVLRAYLGEFQLLQKQRFYVERTMENN